MASGLILFMICRNKTNRPVKERKREGVNGAPPSRFLYIGTVDPHTTRTPDVSSPDVIKHAIIPSIKKTPPPQEAPILQPEKNVNSVFELKSSLPKRAKFGPRTPPPPDLALLQSITSQSLHPTPPPPSSLLAQQVIKPPKVISTWTNFINKPSESASDSPFMSNGDHTEGAKDSESASDSLFMSNGDHTEATKPSESASDSQFIHTKGKEPKLKPSESAYESHFMSNGDHTERIKPKLKPLHWEKVRANSDKATAWDQLKPSSFQLNEDIMESLFGYNTNKTISNESSKRPPAVAAQENRVLNPNKSQNIAILLRALNVTRDEVSQALLDGNTRALGGEVLETLMKMAPTKEEEIKLTCYKGDTSKLGSPERFLKAILDVPFAFKRIESMVYQANFDAEVKYLIKSFQTLEQASSELKNSKLFLKLLEAVLTTGNRMNVGTNRGGAKSFRLDTLLKLVDIKGTDGKTTLLHFVVQEIGPVAVTGLGRELISVKLAAALDSDVLHSSVLKLETGLKKVRTGLVMEGKFFESMKVFHGKAEEEICRLKESERKALDLVREVSEYFHGDSGKEETRRLAIFMIVRDFLSTLDFVCKDMGMVGSFLLSSTVRRDYSSSEESSSP